MIVVEVVFGLAIVVTARPLYRLWMHTTTRFDQKPPSLPWSEEMWRGWVRAMPINAVGAVLLWLLGLLTVFGHSTAVNTAVVVLGTSFVLVLAMGATVIYWNRPRAVVPPDRRHQPGLLSARHRGQRGS